MSHGDYNVKALLDGLSSSIKELTDPHRVVCAPIEAQGKVCIPCISLSFGYGGGGGGGEAKSATAKVMSVSEVGGAGIGSGEGAGAGATAEPRGFLVVNGESAVFVRC